MQSVTIGNNQAGQRLDKFLHKYLPLAGGNFLYKMLRKKNITLNGKKAEGREILSVGDEVRVFFSDETFAKFSGRIPAPVAGGAEPGTAVEHKAGGTAGGLSSTGEYEIAYKKIRGVGILYEDDDFLILDKPAGVLTQKAQAGDVSLNEWMVGYLLSRNPALAEELATFRPSVCNRLDRNTGGIVLGGKSLRGLQYLSECLKERGVRKFYRAICVGRLEGAAQIKGYLVKDAAGNRVRIAGSPGEFEGGAAPVHTVYRSIACTGEYTLLEVELITGKTHQIRAHLAGIGHPLAGDAKYGSEPVNRMLKQRYGLGYQLLHACRVEFPETASDAGRRLGGRSFCAPEPVLFRKMLKALFGGDVGEGGGRTE